MIRIQPIMLFLLCMFLCPALLAQVNKGGRPYSFSHNLGDEAMRSKTMTTARLNVEAMRNAANAAYRKGEILPAGQILPTHLNPGNSGVWTDLPNGDRVWRLQIKVPDAPATSLYYEDFFMPEGASLFVYNSEKTHLIGSYDSENNHSSRMFSTEIVYTEECIVEYYEPAAVRGKGSFTITGVSNVYNAPHPPAYVRLKTQPKCCGFGTSGSCNVNVACPEGSAWSDQIRSVARILVKNGSNQGFCSGALVNNLAQNCKNYFLTANHCGASASAADKNQWIFYFNYQSATCAAPASEPSSNTITGCTMRSSSSNGANSSVFLSDFMLVEFNGAIPASYNVYYAGWNAGGTGGNSGVSIHHPSGDIKKISTYNTTLVSRRYYSQLPDNSHWEANWVTTATNTSITEGGSSGSPLFNSSGLIIGKLSGGPSFCGATGTNRQDYYGKISYSWTSNGSTASVQLKPWLDPANTGTTTLAGRNACTASGCPDIQESNNTQATAGTIVAGTSYNALIASSTDIDHYKFTTTGVTNINVALTTLPADYDVQLLNAAGTAIVSGTSGGTTSESINYSNAPAGTYTVKVFGYNGVFSATSCYTLRVTTTNACSNTPEGNETLATASNLNPNTDLFTQIGSSTDVDWFRFTNSAAQPNIRVTLSGMPGDYDLYLYNSAGTLLGSSTAGGTTAEAIVQNGGAAGTYYVRVIGYSGAFSTSVCYKLRAEISSSTLSKAADASITTTEKAKIISVYPNPVSNKLTLSFSANRTEAGMQALTLTDMSGRTVLRRDLMVNDGFNQINLILPASLGNGVYLLRIKGQTIKVVKE